MEPRRHHHHHTFNRPWMLSRVSSGSDRRSSSVALATAPRCVVADVAHFCADVSFWANASRRLRWTRRTGRFAVSEPSRTTVRRPALSTIALCGQSCWDCNFSCHTLGALDLRLVVRLLSRPGAALLEVGLVARRSRRAELSHHRPQGAGVEDWRPALRSGCLRGHDRETHG